MTATTKSTPVEIKSAKRVIVSAIGDAATFEANCVTISSTAPALELAIMGALAYAFYVFHTSTENKFSAIDRMRGLDNLHAGLAAQLNAALSAIVKSTIPEGETPRKCALAFASERTAGIFRFETKRKAEQRDKVQAARVERLAKEAKAKADELKAAKAEGKAEAKSELELASTDIELALVGLDGHVEPLTAAEHMELAMCLSKIRQDAIDANAASKAAQRQAAQDSKAA